jgi:hypothetical protein
LLALASAILQSWFSVVLNERSRKKAIQDNVYAS